jgi:hypothetical protein
MWGAPVAAPPPVYSPGAKYCIHRALIMQACFEAGFASLLCLGALVYCTLASGAVCGLRARPDADKWPC